MLRVTHSQPVADTLHDVVGICRRCARDMMRRFRSLGGEGASNLAVTKAGCVTAGG